MLWMFNFQVAFLYQQEFGALHGRDKKKLLGSLRRTSFSLFLSVCLWPTTKRCTFGKDFVLSSGAGVWYNFVRKLRNTNIIAPKGKSRAFLCLVPTTNYEVKMFKRINDWSSALDRSMIFSRLRTWTFSWLWLKLDAKTSPLLPFRRFTMVFLFTLTILQFILTARRGLLLVKIRTIFFWPCQRKQCWFA